MFNLKAMAFPVGANVFARVPTRCVRHNASPTSWLLPGIANALANAAPVGARLARDKGTAILRPIASSLIAGKHRSHRDLHLTSFLRGSSHA
jgi:hypothetical protein